MENYGNPSPYSGTAGELNAELDKIVSYLERGSHWHRQIANELRKPSLSLRGFGRWHECEAKGDYSSIVCIEKIVRDKLNYDPKIDVSMIDQANNYMVNSVEDFKASFELWISNEKALVECLNKAVNASRTVDIQLYKDLMCLTDEVQCEIMRAGMAKSRLDAANWGSHDLYICSMMLHKHFEDSDSLDFTLS